jgi:hypothetical protein
MLATVGVDNTAIEAAAAPREAFLGPRLDGRSPFGGALPMRSLLSPPPSRKVSSHATAIAASQTASGEVNASPSFASARARPPRMDPVEKQPTFAYSHIG